MNLPKLLIFVGSFLILAGALLWFLPKGLPGDLRYEGKNFKVYFPWVTCLVLSVLLTLLLRFFQGFKK